MRETCSRHLPLCDKSYGRPQFRLIETRDPRLPILPYYEIIKRLRQLYSRIDHLQTSFLAKELTAGRAHSFNPYSRVSEL